jgi:hypothetical protein
VFLLFGAIVLGAAAFYAARARSRPDARALGWMSEQWLAEHRAAHPS